MLHLYICNFVPLKIWTLCNCTLYICTLCICTLFICICTLFICKHWLDPKGLVTACQACLHSPRPDPSFAFTQLQALTGPEGSSQCLSGLLPFTMARSFTIILRARSEFMRHACSHPTASTEWARRAHSVLVRPACVHHGQIHYQSQLDAVCLCLPRPDL